MPVVLGPVPELDSRGRGIKMTLAFQMHAGMEKTGGQ